MHVFIAVCICTKAVMADAEIDTTLDTSQQLDLLVVRYFQTLADVFKYKQLLENNMKDGFFYMAKVIGVKLVCSSHCKA